MRLLGSNPSAMRETPAPTRFQTVVGQRYTISLQYPTGKLYPSTKPGLPDSVLYTLTDGRRAWFPVPVAQLIDNLRLAPQEPFEICNNGARRGWDVQRAISAPHRAPDADMPPFSPEPADERPQRVQGATAPTETAAPAATPTRLEHALKLAIEAAANAEKFSDGIGHPVRFNAEAIRAMAITVLINAEGGRR